MRVIDLGWPIEDSMQVFPGDISPEIKELTKIEDEGCRSKKIIISSHTGTHMDAPAHMLAGGACLDELPSETFFGFAVIADVSGCAGREIEISDLGLTREEMAAADFLLLHTGYCDKMGEDGYLEGFPVLSQAAARALAEQELKGIGVDAISVDPVKSAECPVHKTILGNGMVVLENLRGLRQLPFKTPFCLTALPLALKGADGAPARVMAVLEK
ncbi:hypothetical protein BED41_14470 [Cloacibacillus porcorum]|uniref:Cyclase n=1 Tax=Cloacibacillus porcorum TaxID=1197717 RepID=A0A1B2I8A5_9BACT|nr:hypothetical protein BED41_14470 [Cloacibacillus porcorum]